MTRYSELEKASGDARVGSIPVSEDPIDKAKHANWKARILIALGLILPIVAGVIGVVAWAVNADTMMGRSKVNTSFRPNQIDSGTTGRTKGPSLSFLNNRVDGSFGTNRVLSMPVSKFPAVTMRSGITRDFSNPNKDVISSSSGQSKMKNDDVFFVQYVPNGKKKYNPTTEEEMFVQSPIDNEGSSTKVTIKKSDGISDLLTKLIKESKDKGKHSQHSLVFSPSTIKSTKISRLANNPNYKVQFDDDFDYISPLDGLQDDTTLKSYSTRSKNSEKSSQTLGPNRSGEQPLVPIKQSTVPNDDGYSGGSSQNYGEYTPSAPSPSSSYPSPVENYSSNNYGQHPPASDYPPSSYPAPVESYSSNNYGQHPPASDYPTSSYPAPVESYSSNNYGQHPPASDYPPPNSPKIAYKNDGSYDNDYQESSYVQGYNDYVPSKGVSLHIDGGGGHGLINPISSLSSLLLPSLGKPKVNLNGRVVLGVVLDKGIGLGGNKGLQGGYIG